MTNPPRVSATEEQLKSFDWLHIEQWNIDKLFNYYGVGGKKLCKICDKWSGVSDLKDHVRSHVAARKRIKDRERKEALERAKESRKLKQEERKREKELNN